uniref:Large ribosomal subunit protein mL66 n=1 Tax=Graphocephala atropunctata TaxID=36148 RepID=A0A1B6KVX7_9HEMI
MFSILKGRNLTLSSSRVLKENIWSQNPQRNFFLSETNHVKTILEKQEGKTLVIEGVVSPSSREKLLVKTEPEAKACPLCRLNLDVKHTDVLILSQFVRQDGCMLPKRITGLCSVQQKRVSYMVTMAHKAGLMGKLKPPKANIDPTKRDQWKKFNTYFDETTIKPPKLFLHMKYKKKVEDFKKSQVEDNKSLG